TSIVEWKEIVIITTDAMSRSIERFAAQTRNRRWLLGGEGLLHISSGFQLVVKRYGFQFWFFKELEEKFHMIPQQEAGFLPLPSFQGVNDGLVGLNHRWKISRNFSNGGANPNI